MQTETKYTLERVTALATKAHKGQTRSNGAPYISHSEAVAAILIETSAFGYLDLLVRAHQKAKDYLVVDLPGVTSPLKDLVAVAKLHDTIEDTTVTYEQIEDTLGVHHIADAVQNLSRDSSSETYFDFIRRIILTLKSPSLTVFYTALLSALAKMADLTHNMSDLGEGSLKDKYRFAYAMIKQELDSL